jgi:hypothetical protein
MADGDICAPDGVPHTIVSASFDGGRSWAPSHFVGKDGTPDWNGVSPGPSFCGASGVLTAAGLLCPGDAQAPASIGPNATGVLELSATVWSRNTDKLVSQPMETPVVLRCPAGDGTLPGGWGPGPVRKTYGQDGALFRVATCSTPPPAGSKKSTNATQVIMRSTDDGWTWDTVSTIPPWPKDVYLFGKYPRADEIALGVVDGTALLVVNRVTTSSVGAQHHYVNYTMCFSGDMGATWTTWGPDHNVSKSMAGQWSVMPKILELPNGEIMLVGGRPGVMMWIGGREEGTQWQAINVSLTTDQRVRLAHPTECDWVKNSNLSDVRCMLWISISGCSGAQPWPRKVGQQRARSGLGIRSIVDGPHASHSEQPNEMLPSPELHDQRCMVPEHSILLGFADRVVKRQGAVVCDCL